MLYLSKLWFLYMQMKRIIDKSQGFHEGRPVRVFAQVALSEPSVSGMIIIIAIAMIEGPSQH